MLAAQDISVPASDLFCFCLLLLLSDTTLQFQHSEPYCTRVINSKFFETQFEL